MHLFQFYLFVQFFSLTFIFHLSNSESICDVQDCVGINHSSPVYDFCNNLAQNINGSCCFNDSGVLLGLDLNGCNISDTSDYLHEMTTVVQMSLRGSEINCSTTNFQGMVKLSNLWLSDKCDFKCPGDSEAWAEKVKDECINQTNSCIHSRTRPFDCPENAHCENNGPGLFHCVCTVPYHGYKCLQMGEFPVITFATTLSSVTVVTSAVLWFLTLRKAKFVTENPIVGPTL